MSMVMLDTANDRLCQTCGYNLRGLTGNRCPECGDFFDPKQLAEARIPWLRRAAIGKWRAYWQTVAMAMFHPLKLGEEVWEAPRIDSPGATRFRNVILVQAVVSVAIAMTALLLILPGGPTRHIPLIFLLDLAGAGSVALFLLIATDILNWGSAPFPLTGEDLWRRALSHYASAPLAAAPIVALSCVLGAVVPSLQSVSVTMFVAMLTWWWIDCVLVMFVVRRSVAASIYHGITLPMKWAGAALFVAIIGIGVSSFIGALLGAFF